MRLASVLAVLSLAALASVARADTTNLQATFVANTFNGESFDLTFTPVNGTLDYSFNDSLGYPASVDFFTNPDGSEGLQAVDIPFGYTFDLATNAMGQLAFDPTDNSFNLGSFAADAPCLLSMLTPHVGATLPTGLALVMFQVPSCGSGTLDITGPTSTSSITPEPSSLALFATGALGIAGVLRRRIYS